MAHYPDDDWVRIRGAQPVPAELLEAVGALSLAYTELESCLYLFFGDFLRVPVAAQNLLFDMLHNRARADLVSALVSPYLPDPDELAAFKFGLKCFDICTENRNLIMHANLWDRDDGGAFVFAKATSGSQGYDVPFLIPVEGIRSAVASVVHTDTYLTSLWLELSERRKRRRPKRAPAPLPNRPPQPRKLSLYRLKEGQ
jgi:hypothetical protein